MCPIGNAPAAHPGGVAHLQPYRRRGKPLIGIPNQIARASHVLWGDEKERTDSAPAPTGTPHRPRTRLTIHYPYSLHAWVPAFLPLGAGFGAKCEKKDDGAKPICVLVDWVASPRPLRLCGDTLTEHENFQTNPDRSKSRAVTAKVYSYDWQNTAFCARRSQCPSKPRSQFSEGKSCSTWNKVVRTPKGISAYGRHSPLKKNGNSNPFFGATS